MAHIESRKFVGMGRTSHEKVSVLYFGGDKADLKLFFEGSDKTYVVDPKAGEFVVKFEGGAVKVFNEEDFEDEFTVF